MPTMLDPIEPEPLSARDARRLKNLVIAMNADWLSPDQVEAIRAYDLAAAWQSFPAAVRNPIMAALKGGSPDALYAAYLDLPRYCLTDRGRATLRARSTGQ